jgi:phage baseplate assembly protein W
MADIQFLRVREYKDLSLTMGRNPVTGDVVTVTGADAVKRSVKNLLYTMVGEVPFFPTYGTTLHHLLFEPIDPITITSLDSTIRATLAAFEPRVEIAKLVITPTPDELQFQIDLTFIMRNVPEPVTLTVFLKRLR